MIETILITGASGFLGRYLVKEFLSNSDYLVIGLYHSNKPSLTHARLTWKQCDLTDIIAIEEYVKSSDYVIHAAAIVSFDPSDNNKMIQFNVTSTKYVVNACIRQDIKKLIHISSISALGSSQISEIDESIKDNPPENYSPYGISKYKSELEIWRGIAEGMNACIINPSLIIGTGDWTKGSPKMISTVANGMQYYPTGSTGFVYAKDVAAMTNMLLHSEHSSERMLCSAENRTYQYVMNLVADQLKVQQPIKPITTMHIKLIGIVNFIKKWLLFSKDNILTSNSLKTANTSLRYNNKKSIEMLQFDYTPISTSVAEICDEYLTSSS